MKKRKGFHHQAGCGIYGIVATCTCKYYRRWWKNLFKPK